MGRQQKKSCTNEANHSTKKQRVTAANVDLASTSLPSAERASAPSPLSLDNTPRRSHVPGAPRGFPDFRNHFMAHLREHVSLSEMATMQLRDFSFSPTEIKIGNKQIVDRNIIAVGETFLTFRQRLVEAIPALAQPLAPLFPSLDGGSLFVSHRPKGMSEGGLSKFVETRDKLIFFLWDNIPEKTFDYLTILSPIMLEGLDRYFQSKQRLIPVLKELSKAYLRERAAWIKKVSEYAEIVGGYENKGARPLLAKAIVALREKQRPTPLQRRTLHELEELQAAFDAERRYQSELRASKLPKHVKSRAVVEHGEDEERITPTVVPVYKPNTLLLFLGTDGGRLVADPSFGKGPRE